MMEKDTNLLLGFLILALCIVTSTSYSYTDVDALYMNLTSGYNNQIRPETNQSVITTVAASFSVITFHDVDEVEGTVTVNGFFILQWRDNNLRWHPPLFQNIYSIDLPQDIIWKPPIVNGNSINQLKILSVSNSKVSVNQNGVVEYYPGDSFTFTCDIDSSKFPFDSQICTMNMLSWGYSSSTIKFHPGVVYTDLMPANSAWELIDTKMTATNFGTFNIPGFKVSFYMKRRSSFFIINLLLPVEFLEFLNMFVFILPQDSGERVGFSITALLAVVVFLTIAQGLLPATATPRLASLYELLIQGMALSGCIVVSIIVGSWMYHRSDDKHVPGWIQKIVSCAHWKNCKLKELFSSKSNIIHVVENGNEEKSTSNNDAIKVQPIVWKEVSNLLDILSFAFYTTWFIVANIKFIVDIQ